MLDRCTAHKIVNLGALVLRLGRVNRITFHPDGRRPESDTDHTVMLGIIGCAFAARFLPYLDQGKIAQYALVHDLVEAYAGDTPTLRITPQQRMEKRMRETQARLRIIAEFDDTLPWVSSVLNAYDRQPYPDQEARYIRALDKLLPKITHVLNHGATFATAVGHMTREELIRRYAQQVTELEDYARDDAGRIFLPLFELRTYLVEMVLDIQNLEVETE